LCILREDPEPRPTKCYQLFAMRDHNLSEELAGLIVTEGIDSFFERKHPINDRLQAIHSDRAVHRDKLGSTTHGYEPQISESAS
jgi:hypothetical protein